MLAASACSETEFEVVEDSEASWMLLECDPIAPSVCGFPFPSNVYTVADDSTPTGRRLELSRALLPASYYGVSPSPQPWNQGDGFSASSAIMTHFPGLTQSSLAASNVATPATIDRSMEFDSPTILIDGVDPFAGPDTETSWTCRVFMSADGIQGAPSTQQLREVMGL